MSKKKKVNWDGDFDDLPLHRKILEEPYQGETEDEAPTYSGDKCLPTLGDLRPFDSVV